MKSLIVFLASSLLFLTSPGQAAEYRCYSETGEQARLSVSPEGRQVFWSNRDRSSESRGIFTHIETAPYTETKSYYLYTLVDYYRTNDSGFVLALDPRFVHGSSVISVVEYFDDDDHAEEITPFVCRRVR